LKPEKPNITNKVILEPNVNIMVKTNSEIDIVAIKINNQMVVIQIQVGKNIVEDVMIDGGANVNVIIETLKTKLSLPKPIPTPYHLRMVDHNMTKSLGIIKNLKIHIHRIPYVTTFIVSKNSVVEFSYYMLLGRPWLIDAKVTHDWGNNVIIVQGNGIVITISINKKLWVETRRP
jgi:hypothetical protein